MRTDTTDASPANEKLYFHVLRISDEIILLLVQFFSHSLEYSGYILLLLQSVLSFS